MSNQGLSLSIGLTLSNFRVSFLNRLLRRWQPETCFLCDRDGNWLCGSCHAELPWATARCCPRCALPGPSDMSCGACLKHPAAFDLTHAALRFAYPIDSVVHAFKYRHALGLARPLARVLQQALPERPAVDALLAMPLSAARLRERGYNQAHELARILASDYHLPLLTRNVGRADRALHQAALPLSERARNVRGVFSVTGPLPPRIAVVDDVMTSGSSLDELARTLKLAGAIYIEAWVLARTYPPNEH